MDRPASRSVFLGVDTGGTYTDAVVYDHGGGTVLGKAKAPTTHDDLAVGIRAAVDGVLAASGVEPATIGLVSLSTTLATNALVEGKGRPAGLVMIGFGPDALERGGLREVVAPDAAVLVGGGHTPHGTEAGPLDVEGLRAGVDAVAPRVEAFAVTGHFAVRNPEHELAARDLIRDRTGLPVTCSHELSDDLDGPKRSVTAVLNAGLIALVDDLVSTTAGILSDRGIDAPVMIVRGNGSLVSASFVRDRPVETILSGPAASLVGAGHLAGLDDAVIVDIGGTTTDIAVLRNGMPEFAAHGATVGGHRTMVEAVAMHTHGLGGDSEVLLAGDTGAGSPPTGLRVGPRRVVPLVVAAQRQDGEIGVAMDRQLRDPTVPGEWSATFVWTTARAEGARLDRAEARIVERIGEHVSAADEIVAGSRDALALRRLVARGVVAMSGFTPTDAAHVLGSQATHDPGPAREGARVWARRVDARGRPVATSPSAFAEAVVAALVRRSAEALLDAAFVHDGIAADSVGSPLVAAALDRTARTTRVVTGLAVPVVALGAPAATYYPAVAELLGADIEVPADADVANAIGAVVGRVRARRQVTVTSPRRGVFRVHTGPEPETVYALDEAREAALERGRAAVAAAMVEAGAAEFGFETHWEETTVEVEGRPMFVEGVATVVGSGPPRLTSG